MAKNLAESCDAVEECYEYMLAYAAQGIAGDGGSSGEQLRTFLNKALDSINNIGESYKATIGEFGLEPEAKHLKFLAVLERDAADAAAAMDLVLAQPVISSQLVDNL